MAYGKKYTAGFCGDVNEYEVNIYQEGYSGAIIEGTLTGNFFGLQYSGDDTNLHTPIKSSQATATLWVTKGSATETFVNELITFQEKKYLLEITRGPIGGALTPMWRGVILQDNFSNQNDCDFSFDITAIDGLARLKTYTTPPVDTGTNMVERIIEMLQQTGAGELWQTSDSYLVTNVRFFEDKHSALTIDPLAYTDFKNTGVHVFYDGDGVATYRSYYEVLENICIAFAAQLKQSNGIWYLMQPTNQNTDNLTVHKYGRAYRCGANPVAPTVPALALNVTEANNHAVNNAAALSTTNGVVVHGSNWLYQPALKRVELIYNFTGNRIVYALANVDVFTLTATGYTVANAGGRINIAVNTSIVYNITMGGGYIQTAWDWYIQIKCGANYWDGAQWSTSAASVYYTTTFYMVSNGVQVVETEAINYTTAALSAGGALSVRVWAVPVPVTGITFTKVSQLTSGTVLLLNTVFDAAQQLFAAGNVNTNTNSSYVLDHGTVVLGDNPGAPYNKLLVHNGTAWFDAELWALNSLTAVHTILKLTVQTVLAMQTVPLRIVDAQIWGGTLNPHQHIKWVVDGVTYRAAFMAGEFTGAGEIWQGTWAVVNINTGNTLPDNPTELVAKLGQSNAPINVINQVIGGKVAQTNGAISGTITSIGILEPGHANIKNGDVITIVNPATGAEFSATVNADVASNATTISVASVAAPGTFPANSVVTISPAANAAKTMAVAASIPVQIAAATPTVVEIDANITLANEYNNQILVCIAGCATITTANIGGFSCQVFNNSAATIEVNTPDFGPSTIADGALMRLQNIDGVGWVTNIV